MFYILIYNTQYQKYNHILFLKQIGTNISGNKYRKLNKNFLLITSINIGFIEIKLIITLKLRERKQNNGMER